MERIKLLRDCYESVIAYSNPQNVNGFECLQVARHIYKTTKAIQRLTLEIDTLCAVMDNFYCNGSCCDTDEYLKEFFYSDDAIRVMADLQQDYEIGLYRKYIHIDTNAIRGVVKALIDEQRVNSKNKSDMLNKAVIKLLKKRVVETTNNKIYKSLLSLMQDVFNNDANIDKKSVYSSVCHILLTDDVVFTPSELELLNTLYKVSKKIN